MSCIEFVNFMGETVQIFETAFYGYDNVDIVNEANNVNKTLKDGEVRLCYYPMFPEGHKKRPAIVIYNKGIGPLLMNTSHIEYGKNEWKKYKENIVIKDWKYEGFDSESYANTKGLVSPKDIRVGQRIGTLTQTDYDRIIKPTIDRLADERMDDLFESMDFENAIDMLDV